MKKLMVTGHRKLDPSTILWVDEQLQETIMRAMKGGFLHFISGGALGVDQWFAHHVLMERRKNTKIQLTIAKPFPAQDARWLPHERLYYVQMCVEATNVEMVSDGPYDVRKIHKRNRWMVDNADAVVAVKRGDATRGGTFQTVNYAKKKGLPIFMIDPSAKTAQWC